MTHGYSKDKRPDLKQFVFLLLCVDGNIPILGIEDLQLSRMIDGYDKKTEGILALITSYSNATYFVTVKLK